MPAPSLDALLRLPRKRKMKIAERLWLSAADEKADAVPASHRKVIATRLEDYRSGKSKPVSHAELMRRLRAK